MSSASRHGSSGNRRSAALGFSSFPGGRESRPADRRCHGVRVLPERRALVAEPQIEALANPSAARRRPGRALARPMGGNE